MHQRTVGCSPGHLGAGCPPEHGGVPFLPSPEFKMEEQLQVLQCLLSTWHHSRLCICVTSQQASLSPRGKWANRPGECYPTNQCLRTDSLGWTGMENQVCGCCHQPLGERTAVSADGGVDQQGDTEKGQTVASSDTTGVGSGHQSCSKTRLCSVRVQSATARALCWKNRKAGDHTMPTVRRQRETNVS